jgi:hypothetical protein
VSEGEEEEISEDIVPDDIYSGTDNDEWTRRSIKATKTTKREAFQNARKRSTKWKTWLR